MKVTVELSDQEMAEVLKLTGERKKGPAIRRLMEDAAGDRAWPGLPSDRPHRSEPGPPGGRRSPAPQCRVGELRCRP